MTLGESERWGWTTYKSHTEHQPEKTRTRLIDAAVSSFSERGYAATNVHHICAVAGLSVGSFYYHFDDKASITVGIYEGESERVQQQLALMDLGRVDSIAETLSELLDGPRALLYRALREAAEVDRRVGQIAADLRRRRRERLAVAITGARRDGDCYRLEAPVVAWGLLALLGAAVSDSHTGEPLARGIAEIVHQSVIARVGADS